MSGNLFSSSSSSVLLKPRIIPNISKLIIDRFKIREIMIKQYLKDMNSNSAKIERITRKVTELIDKTNNMFLLFTFIN